MTSITQPELEIKGPAVFFGQQEESLINSLLSRSESQFKQLYMRYSPALLGIVVRIIKNDVIAEDVLQESFVKIWNAIDSYDASRGRLFTWMASTARHTAIDHLRSKAAINYGRTSNLDDLTTELDQQQRTEFNPDVIGVKQLLNKLQVSEKQILDLIYFQGYTHCEVSNQLDIPLGTVKTRLRRAITLLRLNFTT